MSSAAACRVLEGHPWVAPRPLARPSPCNPRIRQSWAEPLVIPCEVGTGLCPSLCAGQGTAGGTAGGGPAQGHSPEAERDRDTRRHPALAGDRQGHPQRDSRGGTPGDRHPHLDKDHAGTPRDTWGGTAGTAGQGQ
ncbi:hypothetical protein A306_00014316 [Columba livia]|uniref:Uncharacterized protein n=1 Tax=Columba livia TaxID=8932 RepID=A0A2I0LJ86_COLLI|nr:hypothetical protein A306_00014316 [Columba livia]